MAICVRLEIDIETWVGLTFEVPHVVTGPFTSVEKALMAALTLSCVCHLLSHLRERYVSYLQHTAISR